MTLGRRVLILTLSLLLYGKSNPQSFDVIPQTSHVNGTKTAAISPDGNYLVTSGFDCLIKVRNYSTGEVVGQIKTAPGVVNSIIFISGNLIATGDSKGNLAIYDIYTLNKISSRKVSFQQINSVLFDRTSRLFWCAGFGGFLAAIEPDSLFINYIARGLSADVNVADLGNNGYLYLGTTSGTIYLFDSSTRVMVDSISAFSSDVSGLKALSTGEKLIAASYSGEVKGYNYSVGNGFGRLFSVKPEPVNILTSLTVSPSGRSAVVTSFDNLIFKFDTETGKITGSFPAHEYMIAGTVFKNETELLSYSFGHKVFVWDLNKTNSPKKSLNGRKGSVNIIATGKNWMVYAQEDGSVFATDLKHGLKTTSLLRTLSTVKSVALDDMNNRVAVGLADGSVLIADLVASSVVFQEQFSSKEILAVALNRERLVVTGNDRIVRIVNISAPSGKPIVVESPMKGRFVSVAIGNTSNLIALGSNEGVIYFIDPVNGNKVSTLAGHTMAVNSVAFGDSDKFFVSGSSDNSVRFWSTDEILNFKTLTNDLGFISGSIFSGKDQVVAIGEGGTVIYSGVSAKGNANPAQNDISIEFPGLFGDNHFAALSGSGTIILWNLKTGDKEYLIVPEEEQLNILDIKSGSFYSNGEEMIFLLRDNNNEGKTFRPALKKSVDLKAVF